MTATTTARLAAVTHRQRPYSGTPVANGNFSVPSGIQHRGFERKAVPMAPMPVSDVFLTVAIMTGAFIGEVTVFALLGIF
ncbi:hypothetical protein ABIF70_005574 [Bradyrhizobium japonicum]